MKTRRKSVAVMAAENRLSGLKNIDPTLDMGNGMSVQGYQTEIDGTSTRLSEYVNAVAKADAARVVLRDSEAALNDFSDLIMRAVSVNYGLNSPEYVSVGGTRKKDRKRPIRKNISSSI